MCQLKALGLSFKLFQTSTEPFVATVVVICGNKQEMPWVF